MERTRSTLSSRTSREDTDIRFSMASIPSVAAVETLNSTLTKLMVSVSLIDNSQYTLYSSFTVVIFFDAVHWKSCA